MLSPGAVFGNYQVVRELGRGGMGVVYEAEHVQLQKRVAVKVLLPERAKDSNTAQRFMREGQAASRIRHEHVVDVIDVGTHEGMVFLVMEFLDGEALSELIVRQGKLSCQEIADIALPLIDALATAHDAGVVHRDIKPENIFLAKDRRGRRLPKLVDFGISRIETSDDPALARLTSSMVLVGTPCYMAPEAARGGRNVDALSDQYAFGVVLYECITGVLPFERDSVWEMIAAILKERPMEPCALVPTLDPRMNTVIQRAMAREPSDRFTTLRDMGAAIFPMASKKCRAQWSAEFSGTDPMSSTSHASLVFTPSEVPQPHSHSTPRRDLAPAPVPITSQPSFLGAKKSEPATSRAPSVVVALPSAERAREAIIPTIPWARLTAVGVVIVSLCVALALHTQGSSPATNAQPSTESPSDPRAARRLTSPEPVAAMAVAVAPPVLEAPLAGRSPGRTPHAHRTQTPAPTLSPAAPPSTAPVAVLTSPPVPGPVTPPVTAPVTAPVADPVTPPVTAPATPPGPAPRPGAQSLLREDFDPAPRAPSPPMP